MLYFEHILIKREKMKINSIKNISVIALMSLALVGCGGVTDAIEDVTSSYDDESSSYDSSSSSSSDDSTTSYCVGNQTPYGDPQLDTQCQTACVYLEAGSTEGVDATCGILEGWENHADMLASDCPACGSTSSSSSSSDSSTSTTYSDDSNSGTDSSTDSSTDLSSILCTKETTSTVYYYCTGTNESCPSDYLTRSTYSTQDACVNAGENWFETFTKFSL